MNAPPSPFEAASRISRDGLLIVPPPRIVPAGPRPDLAMHPCIRLEILDKAVAKELDPLLLNDAFPFWSTLEGPTVVRVNGVDVFRIVRCPPGTTPSANLSRDVYEAIVADLGFEDDGVVSDEWTDEGLAAARAVLVDLPPSHGLPGWREERHVKLCQAESVYRWYGGALEAIPSLTGRHFVARKSLLKAGAKAASLTLARAEREAEAARIAESARREFEEEHRVNDRSLSALGLDGVCVPHDGFAQVPLALQARASFVQNDATIILWATLATFGLALPPGVEFAGCRVLAGDFVPAIRAKAVEEIRGATVEVCQLATALRRKFMPDADRGPVKKWSTEGIEAAKAFVAAWVHVLYSPKLGQAWIPRQVVECVVRGYLVTPTKAAGLVFNALEETHSRTTGTPPMVPKGRKAIGSIPQMENLRQRGSLEEMDRRGLLDLEPDPSFVPPSYAGAVALSQVGQWAAEAAASGECEPGFMLAKAKPDAAKKVRHG